MQQQKKESSEASLTESLWVLWVGGQGKHAGLHAARAGVGGGGQHSRLMSLAVSRKPGGKKSHS